MERKKIADDDLVLNSIPRKIPKISIWLALIVAASHAFLRGYSG